MTSNASEMDLYTTALERGNPAWREHVKTANPSLFPKLAAGQSPQILWIGCSDSRCPETTILGLQPGDVFVHRNIANILTPTDLSSLSVIQFAVGTLKVQHVVLCGHTNCGGVAGALGSKKLGLLDTWLRPLRAVRSENLDLLEKLTPHDAALKLVELNVRKGITVLLENSDITTAVAERGLKVHGLIYDVGSGELKELDIGEEESRMKERARAFVTE